ncbi:MAG: hypothetical protein KC457_21920 [Myxococcales bacterium]|nr:hypothetical protein [Myxococcales bacterium]
MARRRKSSEDPDLDRPEGPEGDAEYESISAPFPMVRKLQRTLAPDYQGPAYIWDIDKTWLDTRFSQLKGMLKIPFEFAVDKQALPGTTALLHALRQGASGREHRPLYFITASPPFIRMAIERKMLIDGIEFDGISYKDQVEVFRRRHFDSLREHTAFKLSALLLLARAFPAGTRVHLFGDDAERDAQIYCLFADIAAGRLRDDALRQTLIAMGVRTSYADAVVDLAAELEPRERGSGNSVVSAMPEEPSGGKNQPPKFPRELLAAALEGISDSLTRGPILGYPVVDVAVRLVAATFVEGDSSAASFRAAATMGTNKAIVAAGARLLEPVMRVEVVGPDEFIGNVHSDLNTRRGRVLGMEPRGNAQVVLATVPLAEMVGYATSLRSVTQGRASYTMQFAAYSEVPSDLEEQIIKKVRGY